MFQIKNIRIDAEILKLIGELDEFKGKWSAWSGLQPERLQALKKVATIESIGSSTRIEGAKLSDAEVETLLSGLSTNHFASRDEEEVAGYANVMDMIFEHFEQMELTENTIKQLHSVLLKPSKKDSRHRGEYKKFPNHVEAFDHQGKSLGVVFHTTTPFDTPRQMEALVDWVSKDILLAENHPLIRIALFVVIFLGIHPFQDGNGRLSRALTTLLLIKHGYSYIPFTSLESIIEANKEGYYRALRQTQKTIYESHPNWAPWLQYFLRSMTKQKEHLESKMKQERLLGDLSITKLSQDLLSYAKDYGRVTVREFEALSGSNRNTIKANLKNLVSQNKLHMHGKGRGVFYTL